MSRRAASPCRSSGNAGLDRALAYLLASTKRARRNTSLLEVAEQLARARDRLGTLKAVSNLVGISPEMLREFASVEKLSCAVKQMISCGEITSVDLAYRLSMLPESEQARVAKEYLAGELSLRDVAGLVSFRKRNPGITIKEAIERIKRTRDQVQFIVRFRVAECRGDISGVRKRFASRIGQANIVSLKQAKDVANLTISKAGEKILKAEAKRRGVSKRMLVQRIVEG